MKEYICKYCGKTFMSRKGSKNRMPKFCSKGCFSKSLIGGANSKYAEGRKKAGVKKGNTPHNKGMDKTLKCIYCGTIFTTLKHRKYCTPECYHKHQKQISTENPRGKKLICECCGETYYSTITYKGHIQKYCSQKCATTQRYKDYKYTNYVNKTCLCCGKTFTIKFGLRDQRYCSKECSYKARTKYDYGDRVKDRNTAKKRRSLLTKKLSKTFLQALLLAQKGRCAYCGKPLRNDKTIEHMMPVSKGGNNDKWNVVYCCKKCNSSKGALTLSEYADREDDLGLLVTTEGIFLNALLIEKLLNNGKKNTVPDLTDK